MKLLRVGIFHRACVLFDPSTQRGKRTGEKCSICSQPLSGSIHWHSAMVSNLIWEQVASGCVSKFASLIKEIHMKITGCECPYLWRMLRKGKSFSCLQSIHCCLAKWNVSLWLVLYMCFLCNLCFASLKKWFLLYFRILYLEHLFIGKNCKRLSNISVKVHPFMEIRTYVLSCPRPLSSFLFLSSSAAVTSIIFRPVCPKVQSLWRITAFQISQIILNIIKWCLLTPFQKKKQPWCEQNMSAW